MLKSIFIVGLCILLSLVLVSADTETIFIHGGDTETYFIVPVDNQIGLVTPGNISVAPVSHGGSSWPDYNVTLDILSVMNAQSKNVPTSIIIDNPGASLVNANWTLSLYDPHGTLIKRINFISDLPSGRHVIYQNLSLSESLMQGLWTADIVLNTDLQRVEDQKNFTIVNVTTAPLSILPRTISIFNVDLLIWIVLLMLLGVILWLIFGKKRRKRIPGGENNG